MDFTQALTRDWQEYRLREGENHEHPSRRGSREVEVTRAATHFVITRYSADVNYFSVAVFKSGMSAFIRNHDAAGAGPQPGRIALASAQTDFVKKFSK